MPNIYTLPPEFLPQAAKKKSGIIFLLIGVGVLLLAGGVGIAYYVTRSTPKIPASVPPPAVVPPAPSAPTGSFSPPPPPVPETPPPTPPPATTGPHVLQNAPDDDSDGLTNDEELLFKTDPHNPDTDGDTFIDGNEVFNLYNPAQSAPVNLVDSGLVKVFKNTEQHYEVFYPSDFTLDIVDTTSTTVVAFQAKTGEQFIITATDNSEATAPLNYYLKMHPDVSITDLSSVTTKHGLLGIKSPDRLETLLAGDKMLYSLRYDPGNNTLKRYGITFEMMVSSFKIK